MSQSKAYLKAKECIDSTVKGWNRTNLSDLEKWCREAWIVYGEVDMALRFLNFSDYNALKEYIWTEYGFNVGGTSGDREEREE